MKFEEIILPVIEDFISKWNQGKIDQLKPFFTPYAILKSPFISHLFPEKQSSQVQGDEAIILYWKTLSSKFPKFKVVNHSIEKSGRVVTTKNSIPLLKKELTVYFTMNEYAKIETIEFVYEDMNS